MDGLDSSSSDDELVYTPEPGFHRVNLSFPRLRILHEKPHIFCVDQFLSESECGRLLDKANCANLRRSCQTNYRTGASYVSGLRTSSHCILSQREAPSIISRLEELCRLPREHFERLKLVRYAKGEQFSSHFDGYDGQRTGSGFVNSGRLLTLFCYLNSVDEGGCTHFIRLGLKIAPVRGMAVIHLPGRRDFTRDERCEHEGCAAVDEKWVLVCQMWATAKDEAVESGMREVDTAELSPERI